MLSTTTSALALIFIVIVPLTGYAVVVLSRKEKEHLLTAERRLTDKKSTEFLDRNKVDGSCDICFGEFESGEVAACSCGMRFHRECAELTEECPYCKRPYSGMEIREIRRAVCPSCGTVIEKNVCPECWTVVPNKDMRFECVCGNTVYAGDGVCSACGAKFEFTYDVPEKRK